MTLCVLLICVLLQEYREIAILCLDLVSYFTFMHILSFLMSIHTHSFLQPQATPYTPCKTTQTTITMLVVLVHGPHQTSLIMLVQMLGAQQRAQ